MHANAVKALRLFLIKSIDRDSAIRYAVSSLSLMRKSEILSTSLLTIYVDSRAEITIRKPALRSYLADTALTLRRLRRRIVLGKCKKNGKVFNGIFESLLAKSKISDVDRYISIREIRKVSSRRRNSTLIDEYSVGPYTIKVYDGGKSLERLYYVSLGVRDDLLRGIAVEIARLMLLHDLTFYSRRVIDMKLDEIIEHRNRLAERLAPVAIAELHLRDYVQEYARSLTEFSAYVSLSIHRIMPFLIDQYVQEFFCDAPGTRVYLDHEVHGRCRTNIRLTTRDLNALLSHLEADVGVLVDEEHASIKTDYVNKLFSVRVAIDKYPLAVDGCALDVRKHRLRYFTLTELVERGFISAEAAAYLLLSCLARANVLIGGEPGSGKTTLLNALDTLLPRFIRRIYIEDAVESIRQLDQEVHQVRLKVDPLEVSAVLGARPSSKSVEVIKALHRKPDYIVLGELQTREHFIAAFHTMSSGLRCIATCHSRGPEELLLRLTKVYRIPVELFSLLDVIVFTARNIYRGDYKYVERIVEVTGDKTLDVYNVETGFSGYSTKVSGLLSKLGLSYDTLFNKVITLLVKNCLNRDNIELMLIREVRRCEAFR